jgi:hypothetical protein
MFKRIAMLIRGLMGCQSMAQSTPAVVTPCNSAKTLPVKSTQACKDVRKPRQPVAQASLKKPKAVSQTTAVKEGQSKKRKPVATDKQPSTLGKSSRTPVRQTPQVAKPAPKRKP